MRKWLRQKGQTVPGLLGADGSRSEMKRGNSPKNPDKSEIILYQTENGKSRIEVRLADKTVWLSQARMAELFETTPQNITIPVREIYKDGELMEASTCKELLQVQQEGLRSIRRQIKFYNLDMILAVGYRVRSPRGVQFSQWATEAGYLEDLRSSGKTLESKRKKPPTPEKQRGKKGAK